MNNIKKMDTIEIQTSDTDGWGSKKKSCLNPPEIITPGQHPAEDFYDMSHNNRGIAIILNHKIFDSIYFSPRRGTEIDRDALESTLKRMKFSVHVYNDLSRLELLTTLKNVAKTDHSNHDCLVVAVMTHGKNYGRLFARDDEYTTNELVGYFSGDKCPSLAGKPKLFFIQACRGDKTDPGVKVVAQTDSSTQNQMVYTIPAMADILIMYATVEGYYAWRDVQKGSCFIQALVEQLNKNHQKRDLLSMLTLVNRQVALDFTSISKYEDFNEKKEMCSIVSMLTRMVYFN